MRSAHAQELVYPDPAETERQGILPGRPNLTDKQVEFFHVYLSNPFLSLKQICEQANVQQRTVKKWIENSAEFKKTLQREQNRSRAVSNMSRKKVMHGMLEAVEMAKDMRQPNTMISGYKEIGRMCGFYEPERREVILTNKRGKELTQELKTLTREQLLEIAAEQDEQDPGVPEIYDDSDAIDIEPE